MRRILGLCLGNFVLEAYVSAKKRTKSILDYSWIELLGKIESKELLEIYAGYDCIDVLVSEDKVITVSHPERI